MKKLSDYQGEAAIDLWADLMDSFAVIFSDEEMRQAANGATIDFAKSMLKSHKKEVCDILLAIDDTPINGINILVRLVNIFDEIAEDPTLKDFFAMQGQNLIEESSGSATANTKAKEN